MGSGSPLALERVARIAVLSPNRIGDFMFILPALHALKHTYYSAELVLVGRDWHAGFLRGRPGPVDRVLAMPPYPGVGAPLLAPLDPRPAQRFLRRMREARFDLAVQMFGGGRYSNPLVRQFGARMAIGAKADDAPPLDRWVAFSEPNNRRLKLLEVAALAGATAPLLERELEPTDADRREAAAVLPFQPGERLAMLQPGSSDPRRCWPVAHFAAVGDALAQAGAQVLINGSADEAPLVRAVMGAMRRPAVDLAGRLTVRGLCGLLERVSVMVSNDTGPLHLALAVG
ncbi:MAG: glycosyltransferase family 9 protein, partial [Massilia sp.]